MSLPMLNKLKHVRDTSELRQKTISHNLTNAETPHYKPQRIIFDDILQNVMNGSRSSEVKITDPRHIKTCIAKANLKPTVVKEKIK